MFGVQSVDHFHRAVFKDVARNWLGDWLAGSPSTSKSLPLDMSLILIARGGMGAIEDIRKKK